MTTNENSVDLLANLQASVDRARAEMAARRTPGTPCTRYEAANLLRMTSRNNRSGLIGSPTVVVGQTIEGALSALDGLEGIRLVRQDGQEVLTGERAGYGAHSWYLNRTSPKPDPWND
jgi:hypothetical protein